MVPIGLRPRIEGQWGTMVDVINGVNRLGSVLSFLLGMLSCAAPAAAAALLLRLLGASCCRAARAWHIDARCAGAQAKACRGAQDEAAQPAEERLALSVATLPATIRRFSALTGSSSGSMCVYGSGCRSGSSAPNTSRCAGHGPRGGRRVPAVARGLDRARGAWLACSRPARGRLMVPWSRCLLSGVGLLLTCRGCRCRPSSASACSDSATRAQNLIWSTVPSPPARAAQPERRPLRLPSTPMPMLLLVAFDGNGSRDCVLAHGALGFAAYAVGACTSGDGASTQRGRGGGAGGRAGCRGPAAGAAPPEGGAAAGRRGPTAATGADGRGLKMTRVDGESFMDCC